MPNHTLRALSFPPVLWLDSANTSPDVHELIVSDLHRCDTAWWADLQVLQTKVLYLMHTVEKPYLECVPQFGQVVLSG